ncbi:hypothetical protein OH708_03760 [Pseudomonas capsici]|uniref:hypothetical protein n=1 Tax=Pseudomonas capsici TaxID=2810614 RepID=UPI0021F16EEE|nr:hypothetical protein [Pseudomonas capsici]MCV4287017.1 hypothetical protein [Pseudomonas capsici]
MSEHSILLQEQMLSEQKKQTALLQQIATNQMVLIQALAEEQGVEEGGRALTYLDGSPVRSEQL